MLAVATSKYQDLSIILKGPTHSGKTTITREIFNGWVAHGNVTGTAKFLQLWKGVNSSASWGRPLQFSSFELATFDNIASNQVSVSNEVNPNFSRDTLVLVLTARMTTTKRLTIIDVFGDEEREDRLSPNEGQKTQGQLANANIMILKLLGSLLG